METTKKMIINSAILAISTNATLINANAAPPKKGDSHVECFGINTCKGTNGCSVSEEQIKLANQNYKNKYPKSTKIDCSGMSNCSAKNGFLAWINKNSEKECFALGGFIFTKNNNSLNIKDK